MKKILSVGLVILLLSVFNQSAFTSASRQKSTFDLSGDSIIQRIVCFKFKAGTTPKANLALYLGLNIQLHGGALKKLGKHKTGVGCLYINKLGDVDIKVLEEMIDSTVTVEH